ncbi:predicted protein [Nematostella vectensis]|uniref:SEC7 domain-containing protein n=1 Tax=Nematostella vectensis TaxID=45351 RepID=A7T3S2_NEMVE|nr:predicted protein [Nematostella vectensis]|eukprot:XP_001621495.1 hypothetical protein NEMVEDRAFT_v1g221925 [Nematostella vectensis]
MASQDATREALGLIENLKICILKQDQIIRAKNSEIKSLNSAVASLEEERRKLKQELAKLKGETSSVVSDADEKRKPEKGVTYLIAHQVIDDNPEAVAKFLLSEHGVSKQRLGEYLGNLQNDFNMAVLKCFAESFDFTGMEIDVALRTFLAQFRIPGEAQKIERLMEDINSDSPRKYTTLEPSMRKKSLFKKWRSRNSKGNLPGSPLGNPSPEPIRKSSNTASRKISTTT